MDPAALDLPVIPVDGLTSGGFGSVSGSNAVD
jgi:hypothetical protein